MMIRSNLSECGFVCFLCGRVGFGIVLVKRKMCESAFLLSLTRDED